LPASERGHPGWGGAALSEPFRILMLRYQRWLLVETRARCNGDAARAEDCVAEAFTRLLENFREELPPEAACVSWLRKTIGNLLMMGWRRQRTQQRNVPTLQGLRDAAALHGAAMLDDDVLPYRYPIRNIPEDVFEGAVRQLKPEHRAAFRLWVEDVRYDEMGRRLGITPGAARKRVHDARQKLISMLQPFFSGTEVH